MQKQWKKGSSRPKNTKNRHDGGVEKERHNVSAKTESKNKPSLVS